jgi:hypothetical protein
MLIKYHLEKYTAIQKIEIYNFEKSVDKVGKHF